MYKIIILTVCSLELISCGETGRQVNENDAFQVNKSVNSALNSNIAAPSTPESDSSIVTGELKFFKGGSGDAPPRSQRIYAKTFKKYKLEYVFYELALRTKVGVKTGTAAIKHTYYNPSGTVFCEEEKSIEIDDEVKSVNTGCAPKNGTWSSGTYKVVMAVNNKDVAEESFIRPLAK